jgi:phosphomannomutase
MPKAVVIGYDISPSSYELSRAVIQGLTDTGSYVIDIGQCDTEEIYFATSHLTVHGGICVTASHTPICEESKPISGDTGPKDIQRLAEENSFAEVTQKGVLTEQDTRPDYIEHLLTYVKTDQLKPLNIVCNIGNGGAGW